MRGSPPQPVPAAAADSFPSLSPSPQRDDAAGQRELLGHPALEGSEVYSPTTRVGFSTATPRQKLHYAFRVGLPATLGIGHTWLLSKQREVHGKVSDNALPAEDAAFTGLLPGRLDRGHKGGSLGLAVLRQSDRIPKAKATAGAKSALDIAHSIHGSVETAKLRAEAVQSQTGLLRCCHRRRRGTDVSAVHHPVQPDPVVAALMEAFQALGATHDEDTLCRAEIEAAVKTQPIVIAAIVSHGVWATLEAARMGSVDGGEEGGKGGGEGTSSWQYSFAEMRAALGSASEAKDIQRMRALFERADADGSGALTAMELHTVLPYVSDSQMQTLIEEFDTNMDGMFTFDEIVGMYPRLKELGAEVLPIRFSDAWCVPLEALETTSIELAMYFHTLRVVTRTMLLLGAIATVSIITNLIVNGIVGAYGAAASAGTHTAPGLLSFTSAFPHIFRRAFSFVAVFYPPDPAARWSDYTGTDKFFGGFALIVQLGAAILILGILIHCLVSLTREIANKEAEVDGELTTPSDFTLSVRYIPSCATAEQLAAMFGKWGTVAKVVVHRPCTIASLRTQQKISMRQTELNFARRKREAQIAAEQALTEQSVVEAFQASGAATVRDGATHDDDSCVHPCLEHEDHSAAAPLPLASGSSVVDIVRVEGDLAPGDKEDVRVLGGSAASKVEESGGGGEHSESVLVVSGRMQKRLKERLQATRVRRSSLAMIDATSVAKDPDVVAAENEIVQLRSELEEIEATDLAAAAAAGDAQRFKGEGLTPYSTAFVSYTDETSREACERAWHQRRAIDWLRCTKRAATFGETLGWNDFEHAVPATWAAEREKHLRTKLDCFKTRDSACRKLPRGDCLAAFFALLREFCGMTLSVERAVEPNEVVWANMHISAGSRMARVAVMVITLIVFGTLVATLTGSYVAYVALQNTDAFNDGNDDPFVHYILVNLIPIVISNMKLVMKLAATKLLLPAVLLPFTRPRTTDVYESTLIIGTFAVETMETVLLIVTSFIIASTSTKALLGAQNCNIRTVANVTTNSLCMPVPETDVEVGYSVAEAMGYMVTIVMINTAFSLMITDSPGMIGVHIKRGITVLLPNLLFRIRRRLGMPTDGNEVVLKVPNQRDMNQAWLAPKSSMIVHVWLSKVAACLFAVSTIGAWYPIIYLAAIFQLGSMYSCELFSTLNLYSKPEPRGFGVAHLYGKFFIGCIVLATISTGTYTLHVLGGFRGLYAGDVSGVPIAMSTWPPVIISISLVALAYSALLCICVTPLGAKEDEEEGGGGEATRVVVNGVVETAAAAGACGDGEIEGGTATLRGPALKAADVQRDRNGSVFDMQRSSSGTSSRSVGRTRTGSTLAAEERKRLRGSGRELTPGLGMWDAIEIDELCEDDSERLNEAGLIETHGSHHPLRLLETEVRRRGDMHAYAPFAVLRKRGAVSVAGRGKGGRITQLCSGEVWEREEGLSAARPRPPTLGGGSEEQGLISAPSESGDGCGTETMNPVSRLSTLVAGSRVSMRA